MKGTKPDIVLNVGWTINTMGSIYSCDYNINAIDAYSKKAVCPIAGQTGERRRTVPLSVALKETAKNNMDDFCDMLNNYFDDIEENGREVRLSVRIVDNGAGINMNTEFNDTELAELIQNWMNDNTVNNQNTLRNSGRNMLTFDQVRIPLKDSKGRPYDAKGLAKGLQKYLKQFGLVCEINNSSLGYGRVFIGEK